MAISTTTFFWIVELNFFKVHKVTKSTDFDKIFELDIGNVLKMTCTKFEVHTSHHSEDPHENVNFSQKNLKFLGIPRNISLRFLKEFLQKIKNFHRDTSLWFFKIPSCLNFYIFNALFISWKLSSWHIFPFLKNCFSFFEDFQGFPRNS